MNLVHSLLLLFLVAAILVQGRSVVSSKGIFIGVDNTDPNASGADIFRDPRNHATAAASVIGFASKQSGFRPKEQGLRTTLREFQAFHQKIVMFPGFMLTQRPYSNLDLTGDLDQFKEQISANYVSIMGKADVAATAFVEQIPESAEPESSGTWTLVLVTIYDDESNNIFVDIASIEVEVSVNGDGSVSLRAQIAKLNQSTVQVITGVLIANADRFGSAIQTKKIETFKDELTTANSEVRSQLLKDWLFGSNHACKSEFPLVHRRQRLYPLLQL
ncbi:MAG: hypothetical protein J3Q66DRAFT_366212 [Benniella sp.]|nr:MAG: hypothetical protein J3Q66DRAFT_366212 [Benniella sp.]